MGKKTYYINVERNESKYRVYMDDLKKIHKASRKQRPALPAYDQSKPNQKWE